MDDKEKKPAQPKQLPLPLDGQNGWKIIRTTLPNGHMRIKAVKRPPNAK